MDVENVKLNEITIELVKEKDIILAIVRNYQNYFEALVDRDEHFIFNIIEKIYCNGFLIACMYQDKVIGFCAFYANDIVSKTAFITLIATNKDFQNIGLGKLILQKVCEISSQVGMNKIRLEVNNNNVNAIRFYAHNGFNYEKDCSDYSKYMIKKI